MAKYSNELEDNLDLTDVAVKVLEKRYLKKEKDQIIETADNMFNRVAYDIALADKGYGASAPEIEKTEKKFYEMMSQFYFLPNSPTLMNAGQKLQQLSACFVLPIEDSIEKIFETMEHMAIVHKSGGGTGFSFSKLRPNGSYISSTETTSPGTISFLACYNGATEQIKQGGKRRGANMGVLRVDHPDILEFIYVKEKEGHINNFNLSVGATAEFMQKVFENGYIELKDPREGFDYTIDNLKKKVPISLPGPGNLKLEPILISKDNNLINRKTQRIIGKVEDDKLYLKAKDLLKVIAEQAWRNGEPGIVFLDKINEANPTPSLGKIESTNPCGEQPLLPYESCNLGSINLGKFVQDGKIDYSKLEEIVQESVHFLDNVIDRNKFPLKKIEKITRANRKIGLGIMGFTDMLLRLKIPYISEEAVKKAEEIMSFIQEKSKEASVQLAEKRGAFPNFDKSVYNSSKPLRNATTTTVAPTGTIGVIAGASQGIEPLFNAVQERKVKESLGHDLFEVNQVFEEIAKERGFYSEELLKKISEKGSIQGIEEIPKDVQELFVTAYDAPVKQHLKIQATFQKHTDNAVSKTINMPSSATVEDILNAYTSAYKLGCKGVTIYRKGSRELEVIVSGEKEQAKIEILKERIKEIYKELGYENNRPKSLPAIVTRERIGGGKNTYHALGFSFGKPYELFSTGKNFDPDSCGAMNSSGLHISRRLQHGEDPKEIAKDISGTPSSAIGYDEAGYATSSIFDAQGNVLINRGRDLSEEDKEKLIEDMIKLELIFAEAQLREKRKKLANANRFNNKFNGNTKENIEKENKTQFLKEPCPGCSSQDYEILYMSTCEYNSCCMYSRKCT